MRLMNVANDSLAAHSGLKGETYTAGGWEDVEFHLRQAFAYHFAGNRKLGFAEMRTAREAAFSESRLVSRMVATAWCLIGEWAEAVPLYQTLTRLAPSDARSHCGLGLAWWCQGRVEEAAAALGEAAVLAPHYAGVQYGLGLIAKDQGRSGEAVECFRRALKGRMWDEYDDVTLAELFASESRRHEAAVARKQGKRPGHKTPALRLRLAWLHCLSGDFVTVRKEFQKLTELDPKLASRLDCELSLNALLSAGVLADEEVTPNRPSVYQLRVTLRDTHPPIWRRILVPGEISLFNLHRVIQTTMGWDDQHLHRFVVSGIAYGVADQRSSLYVDGVRDERRAQLNVLVRQAKAKFGYEYDFGDDWRHDILVEEILVDREIAHALCIDGRRACPPEDCGGVWGYESLLEALEDPEQPQYEEPNEWAKGRFEPEAFFPQHVNHRLEQIRLTGAHAHKDVSHISHPG